MEDYAIKVNKITKTYNLYNKPIDRLKESLSLIRHKSYHKDFNALNELSFEVKKGECFGIIGVNGSGKSTTLKIITDVLNPTSGNVEVNGRVSALLELGAGFNMDYTGIENIYLSGMVMGYSRDEIKAKIPAIEEFAAIGDFINQPVKLYSSGMFARLAFAVSINVDPDILIVDEALSVGDIFFQAKCYKKFDDFKKMGKTILFVSHDMSSIIKYCDRVLLLNKGNKIDIGSPKDMVNIYKKILANTFDEDDYKNKDKKDKITDTSSLMKSHLALNPNPTIYGGDKAEIVDFGIFNSEGELTNTLSQGEESKIKMVVKFHEDVDSPIFAWKLKNNKGLEITGTNTMYENMNFGLVKAGSVITITFKMQFALITNQYLLDLGCTRLNGDNLEVLHRNHEITTIDIISERENVGIVNPYCIIEVERK